MDGTKQYDERRLEQRLTRAVKRLGGLCWKFISPGHDGVPDRIIILPHHGSVIFVEMKAPGKKERPIQRIMQDKLRQMGATVFSSVDSEDKIDDVIVECIRRVFQTKPGEGGGER